MTQSIHIGYSHREVKRALAEMVALTEKHDAEVVCTIGDDAGLVVCLKAHPGDTFAKLENNYALALASNTIVTKKTQRANVREGPQENGEIVAYTVCNDCKGTGVFTSSAVSLDIGVVCKECGGSGYAIIKYRPFMGPRTNAGVTRVCLAFKDGQPLGEPVSYMDFRRGQMPS